MHVVLNTRTRPHVPIIVLSARMLESRRMAVVETPVGDYVTKPFSTAEPRAIRHALLHRDVGKIVRNGHD
jgi:DNA-binding response OmpR family regulator